MPLTTTTLYRSGNTTSPRMDNVRVPRDIPVYQFQGEDWVAPNTGGISTSSSNNGLSPTIWRLPQSYNYDDQLLVFRTGGTHYLWEPAVAMKLADFKTLLQTAGQSFLNP